MNSGDDRMDSQQIVQAVPVVTPKPAFMCVMLKPDGQVEKIVDRPLDECLKLVESSDVAWIDYTTLDLEKDLEKVVAAAGLSQLPIHKLLSGFYSSYEDADTELGMMFPAVSVKRHGRHRAPADHPHEGQFHHDRPRRGREPAHEVRPLRADVHEKDQSGQPGGQDLADPGAHHRREQRPELRVPAGDREARGRHQPPIDRREAGQADRRAGNLQHEAHPDHVPERPLGLQGRDRVAALRRRRPGDRRREDARAGSASCRTTSSGTSSSPSRCPTCSPRAWRSCRPSTTTSCRR